MKKHALIGIACLVCVTLPFDIAGIHSSWVVIAGVTAGLAGMLGSAWVADRGGVKALGCRYGFHRWREWEWVAVPAWMYGPEITVAQQRQFRECDDCGAVQGPLVSSEERRYYESWRDR